MSLDAALERLQDVASNEKKVAWALFSFLCFVFTAVLVIGQLVMSPDRIMASDGVGYFSHLPSILLDGDIDYRDEFRAFGREERNHWPIGSAIAWLPFFLVGHVFSLAGATLGYLCVTDGTGYPEQVACCFASIVFGTAGVALSYRLACRWLDPRWSLLGTVSFFAGSNLPYYLLSEPYMSHGVSVFWVSLLLYLGLRDTPLTLKEAALFGLIGGLAALTRPLDGLFLLLPFVYRLPRLRRENALRFLQGGLVAALLSALLFSAQVFIWRGTTKEDTRPANTDVTTSLGETRTIATVPGGEMAWDEPKIRDQLLGSHHGLLLWNPIYLFGFLGLAVLGFHQKRLSYTFVLGVTLQLYLVSVWGGQGQTFGGRMFLCCFPCFALANAALYCRAKKPARHFLLALHFLLTIWNIGLIWAYRATAVKIGHFPTLPEIIQAF